jgi:hypothetical protein
MKNKDAQREEKVQKCIAEIRARLPQLEDAHSPLVVIAALTEYMGNTLYLAQQLNVCGTSKARTITDRVRQISSTDSIPTAPTNGVQLGVDAAPDVLIDRDDVYLREQDEERRARKGVPISTASPNTVSDGSS